MAKFLLPSKAHPLVLNYNENSIGMSPKAQEAIIDVLPSTFCYPDATRETLIQEIAREHQISVDHIALLNGSNEGLQAVVIMMAYHAQKTRQNMQLIVPEPTFHCPAFYAQALGVEVLKIPLDSDLAFDIETMKKACHDFSGLSLVYLCNPNNPTGTIVPDALMVAWFREASDRVLFLIDEAYADYVRDARFKSAKIWLKEGFKNIVLTRTFSKLHAMAGLRIAYALAHPDLISRIEAYLPMDNVNTVGILAALASLRDKDFLQKSLETINISRDILTHGLDDLGLRYLPSEANFIFHRISGNVIDYQERMKAYYVWVGREFPPLMNWNRVTLGKPDDMRLFVEVLKRFRQRHWV